MWCNTRPKWLSIRSPLGVVTGHNSGERTKLARRKLITSLVRWSVQRCRCILLLLSYYCHCCQSPSLFSLQNWHARTHARIHPDQQSAHDMTRQSATNSYGTAQHCTTLHSPSMCSQINASSIIELLLIYM